MYQRPVLGLSEARAGVEAALAEASKKPDHPMAVAVVDDQGSLVYFARQDGAYALYGRMAINKAYTAALMMRDTRNFLERSRKADRELGTWGDGRVTAIPGGQCIINPGEGYIPGSEISGTVVGGIGMSGDIVEEDERIAIVGAEAIKKAMKL